MYSLKLKGRISPLKRCLWESPDYLSLPPPSIVNNYSIIQGKDSISWEVLWRGKEECLRVINSAESNLYYWNKTRLLFKKYYKNNSELIKMAEHNERKWKRIISQFNQQLKSGEPDK